MTVYRDTSTTRDISTDAQFRAWAQSVHDALAAVGLVRTSDTGQIDLTTVAAPSTNNFAGYEIWRFNDTNQGGDPIYFKIEYGKGTLASRAALQWTFGTGSNGSGTINGSSGTVITQSQAVTSPTGPELHVCAIDGVLVLCDISATTGSTSTAPILMLVERLRDSAGAIITSGVSRGFVVVGGGVNGALQERKNATWDTSTKSMTALGAGSGADPDGRKRLSPLTPGENYPLIGLLIAKSDQVVAGDSGAASIYGASHTYKVYGLSGTLPSQAAPGGFSSPGANSCRWCLLNE